MQAHTSARTSADGLVDRLLLSSDRWSTTFVTAGLVTGMGLAYAITYALGGTSTFGASIFFLLVIAAAVRLRYPGALMVTLIAGLLAGPLMPLDVTSGDAQQPSTWIARIATFMLLCILTSVLVNRVRIGQARELLLAQKERDLAVGKAAVIATVAHEFRSPLTVIHGVARMLENEHAIPEVFVPLFEGLMESTDRLIDLVTTMGAVLDGGGAAVFLRTETLVTREVMGSVASRVAARDAHGRLQVEVAPDAEFLHTDRELAEQLLRHIMENALKFSPLDQEVQVRVSRDGDLVAFDVADRGPGIDEALLLTDPFHQGDSSITREQAGLGLGLFAAARIAQMLGGSLTFDARPGGGTIVRIRIASQDI
ncbi:MAG: ATP-binding protein [Actinomycetota bacterium]